MPRSLYLIFIIFSLFLTGLITLRGEILTLAIPFVVYLLSGFIRDPGELQIEVTRQLSADRVPPGTPVEITLTITNRGYDIEELFLEDILPPALGIRDGSPRSLVTLSRGQTHTMKYVVEGPRGGYTFETLRAKADDHLAVTSREVRLGAKGHFFVFPPIIRLRYVAIRPRRTRVYSGMIPARAGGTGVEFFGVRAYQAGDSPRWINWRASARHTELYTNEYQQERVADVAIVLDGRLRTNLFAHGQSLFERSISAAASLADAFLTQGDRVGLLLYSHYLDWTVPGYGKVQRERILHALANAQMGESMVFTALKYIPARLFPPESQLVVVSPLTEDDFGPLVQLRALGYQVLIVSPDPVSFEAGFLAGNPSVKLAERVVRLERNLLLRKLQRAGIQVLDWNVKLPFDQLVRQRLGRVPALLHGLRSRS